MTFEPAALRAIADELEAAQRAATTQAIERLTELVNGSADRLTNIPELFPAGAVRDDADAGPTRSESAGSTPAPRSTQVPEAPPVAKPAAVGLPPGVASGTGDPLKVRCRECQAEMLPRGLAIHMAKRHGIRSREAALSLSRSDGLAKPEPLRAHHTYLCPHCNKPFEKLTDLDAHKLTHDVAPRGRPFGERPGVVGA